jgi:carboxyl-terminal processing protease
MRKYLIILLSIVLLSCNSEQQLTTTQKLHLTAKVWGFLKYYHPKVNEGKINWDQHLVDIITKLDNVKTKQDLSETYIKWIESLGEVQPCGNCEAKKENEYFDKNFDLSWLENDRFTTALVEKLVYIKQNRTQRQHFISLDGANQIFNNEPQYTAWQWNDENVRLITLFKFWNVIEYFYPYKYVMDKNWDDLLLYFIPKFKEVKTEQEYHLLIRELAVSLCDSHSFFLTDLVREYAGKKYIAGDFMIINNKAVLYDFYDDSLARMDDLSLGDAILAVNDTPVSDIYKKNEKYINGSNEAVKTLWYSSRWICNGNTDSVKITFDRMGKISTKTIRRYPPSSWNRKSTPVKKWEILNGNIGYVNMEEDVVTLEDLPQMMKEFNNTKAVIFDLRGYPAVIWDEVTGYFNYEKKVSASYTQPDLTYPGRFIMSNADSTGRRNPFPYKGKVVILMNEETQSRGEAFVMALQTIDGAITVGRQTSGADGNVSEFTFFDDKTTWITGLGVFYPDGRETQRIGIIPDIEVPLTIEDIRMGRDAILDKAIETITKK